MTEACIQRTANNRKFLMCDEDFLNIDSDILPKEITIKQSEGNALEYSYTAELWANGKLLANAGGTVILTEDEPQKADVFTLFTQTAEQ